MTESNSKLAPAGRLYAFLLFFLLCSVALVARAVNLQVVDTEELQDRGEARYLRDIKISAPRGNILDRNGEPLAVSTPVDSVAVSPKKLLESSADLAPLAEVLGYDHQDLERKITQRASKDFSWLRRRVHPAIADEIRALNMPGVTLEKEYKRFYPAGEVVSHVVGFTNIDDEGQEGLELLYNEQLKGRPGVKRVIKDRLGRTVEHVEIVREPRPGQNLTLTIDRRLQYLAYRELKRTVVKHNALSGSVVLLDVENGEVLAMVNQPFYNPNDLGIESDGLKNRAITDVFEPGSVMKPFVVAAALESGRWAADTPIDTTPGQIRVGRYTISDHRNYGPIDVTRLITKSSNVAATKIAMDLEPEHMWTTYDRFGFGNATGIAFPGESAGRFRSFHHWSNSQRATLSYGYGISVTVLQLAQAFAAIADDGRMRSPTLIKDAANPAVSVVHPQVARELAYMLETVTGPEGTGKQARVENYRVAGKTGTSRKAGGSGYKKGAYIASFAGFAPVSDPRLVAIVMVNEPSEGEYYGGLVAAPLFSAVMTGAMRLMNIPPDDYVTTIADAGEEAISAAGGLQ